MNLKLKTRESYIDLAKGITILLVIIGHMSVPFWTINLIYFFHMPLFIILSGLNYKNMSFKKQMIFFKKIISSYLFYGVVFIMINIIRFGFDADKIILVLLGSNLFAISFFGVFWFLISILIIKLITVNIKLNLVAFFISMLLFFVVLYFAKENSSLKNYPFAIFQSLVLLVFFIIGIYIKKIRYYQLFTLLSLVLFFAISIYSIYYFGGFTAKIVNYHELKAFNSIIAFLLSVTGSLLVIQFSKLLANLKTNFLLRKLQFIGEYSFSFYTLHLFVLFALKKALPLNSGLLNNFVLFLLTLITIYLGIFFVKKYIKNQKIINLILLK